MALVERLRAAGVTEDDLREVVSFGELLVEQQEQIEAHIVSAQAGGGGGEDQAAGEDSSADEYQAAGEGGAEPASEAAASGAQGTRVSRARQAAAAEAAEDSEAAEIAAAEAARHRRSGAGRRTGAGGAGDLDFEDGWWFDDAEEGGPSSVPSSQVPYSRGFRWRPRRLFEDQEFLGKIEACNTFLWGEYEEVVAGWSSLAIAAQYELEYLLPIVGRVYDVLVECSAANRHDPGRVPSGILGELRAIVEFGQERVDGQLDRARIASGHGSRGHTVDIALANMLDLRDDRLDRGEFQGSYGKKKRQMADKVRAAEITLRARSAAAGMWGGSSGGRGRGRGGGSTSTNLWGDWPSGGGGGGHRQPAAANGGSATAGATAPAPAPAAGKGSWKGGRARGRGK